MGVSRIRKALTGNEAQAEAMRQINPDVVAAYPITPQTETVQIFASFVADGLVDTEMVRVESEHSAMSACIGAAAAGARAMTATSANGLALMWEVLYIAASLRLPIVMALVNRALSGNLNIHCDHSDAMGARNAGWIQLFCEDAQEVYDNMIQAVPIAERARLPVMVCSDGFIISHAMQPVDTYPDEAVRAFVGEYQPAYSLLDVEHPITVGPLDLPDYYFEHKRSQAEAMRKAKEVILQVAREFEATFGTRYGLLEPVAMEDAEVALMALGSTAGTIRAVLREMRAEGKKVGLLKVRVFRPWPFREIAAALSRVKVVGVMDRAEGFAGFGGPLFDEVRSALYDAPQRPLTVNYIYGLGGRDIGPEEIRGLFEELLAIAQAGKVEEAIRYVGLREASMAEAGKEEVQHAQPQETLVQA